MRRTAAIALAAFLIMTAQTEAGLRELRGPVAAMSWWNQWPTQCTDGVELDKADDLPGKVIARAWVNECRIEVDRAWNRSVPWPTFCQVYLHEWGHLIGWRDPVTGDVHSSDPTKIMYRNSGHRRPPRVCR